jgi:DNA helicase-2/ATP-dependent DNA helicase PcrA
VFSCSKIEQKQLNTWVSFQSAEQPLLGQFSVSGNILATRYWDIAIKKPRLGGVFSGGSTHKDANRTIAAAAKARQAAAILSRAIRVADVC